MDWRRRRQRHCHAEADRRQFDEGRLGGDGTGKPWAGFGYGDSDAEDRLRATTGSGRKSGDTAGSRLSGTSTGRLPAMSPDFFGSPISYRAEAALSSWAEAA